MGTFCPTGGGDVEIATPYLRRRDGNVTPYRRQGGMGPTATREEGEVPCYAVGTRVVE